MLEVLLRATEEHGIAQKGTAKEKKGSCCFATQTPFPVAVCCVFPVHRHCQDPFPGLGKIRLDLEQGPARKYVALGEWS